MHSMDPWHKPATASGPALDLVPHSALVVGATAAPTALGMQDDQLDFDASQFTHPNDSAMLVRFTRFHGVVDADL